MLVKVNADSTIKFPYSIFELKNENPNTSFPQIITKEILNDFNVFEVSVSEDPVYNAETQYIMVSKQPSLVDGVWTITKMIVNFSEDEIIARQKNKENVERQKRLFERKEAVQNIVVTTLSGKSFDGDEDSQNRMTRAIFAMNSRSVNSIEWKLSDNTFSNVTVAELTEALALSGEKQRELWIQFG